MPSRTTETRLQQALDRLVKGDAVHPDLQGGNYKLTPTNLSKEAGISRNTLYTIYRPFLDELREAQQAQRLVNAPPQTAVDKIAELRQIIRQLRLDIRNLATEKAHLLARATKAESERDIARRKPSAPRSKQPPK